MDPAALIDDVCCVVKDCIKGLYNISPYLCCENELMKFENFKLLLCRPVTVIVVLQNMGIIVTRKKCVIVI